MVDSNSAQQTPPTPQKVEENLPEHDVAYFRMGDGIQLLAFAGVREDQSSHLLSIQLPILQKHPLPKLLLDLLPCWFARLHHWNTQSNVANGSVCFMFYLFFVYLLGCLFIVMCSECFKWLVSQMVNLCVCVCVRVCAYVCACMHVCMCIILYWQDPTIT